MATNRRNRFTVLAKKENTDPATPKINRFEALVKRNPSILEFARMLHEKGDEEEYNKVDSGNDIKPADSKDPAENMEREG